MGRKWKFALLLVFKDRFATVHHIISTSLSLASPSSGWLVQSTRFKRQDGQKIFRFAKSQMSASTRLEKKYILKKMSGISLELLFLLEAGGSWRGEEGWDVYEVCREFGRKLTEGGQMVGGAGSETLSLSLLGRPVQAQPWSRMARSHLQQAAAP